MKEYAIGIIRWYQYTISPKQKSRCRFYPKCSEYGVLAIGKYGLTKGIIKTLLRLLRCTPRNTESCIDFP